MQRLRGLREPVSWPVGAGRRGGSAETVPRRVLGAATGLGLSLGAGETSQQLECFSGGGGARV